MHVSEIVKAVVEKTSTRIVGIVVEQLASLRCLRVEEFHTLVAPSSTPFEGYKLTVVLRAMVRRRCQT